MTGSDRRGDRQKILIAGAGVAGLEAALALRDLAGDRVEVSLHDSGIEFAYRPFGIGEPYGTTRAFRYDLRRLSELCGASLHTGAIAAVEPERRIAISREGERFPYDHLILATGARALWAVPGAVTFWGVADEGQVGDLIVELRSGRLQRLVLTMPAEQGWYVPLYELAVLVARVVGTAASHRARITVVTPEAAPLGIFGARAAEQTRALLAERRVDIVTGARPLEFAAGRLRIDRGEDVEADAVIALPRLEGREVSGIPHDRDGFVAVDEHGAVIGLERIYAAGDITSLPFKQGAFATQQADSVAEEIAAAVGVGIEPSTAVPRMRAVLWTGQGPHYLSAESGEPNGKATTPSQRHLEFLHNGRLTARYLSPLVDSLLASIGSDSAEEDMAEVPQRV
jgi:sulfide:quinone oxidoreductase